MSRLYSILDKMLYRVESYSIPSFNVPANAYAATDITISPPTGYKVIGIVGITVSFAAAIPTVWNVLSDTKVKIGFRNVQNSAVSQSGTVYLLLSK